MTSVREHFEREAAEYLDRLEAQIAAGTPDVEQLRRHSRGLRGEAQMAREDRVQEVAASLESAVRAFATGSLGWSGDVRERASRTLDDIRFLIAADETPAELEERVARAVERWKEVGIGPAVPGSAGAADVRPQLDEFSRFASVELGAIVAELDGAFARLDVEPGAREPITAVLRRQRALLGAAHVDRLGPAAGTLRALDQVGRVAAAPGSRIPDAELRTFLQAARDALSAALAVVGRGDTPGDDPAFDRLADARRRVLPSYDERAGAAAAADGGAEEEFPVEVLNYFRSESAAILRHLDRIAAELTGSPPEGIAALRSDARSALSGLRDTATTFGFHSVARRAEELLARSGHIAPGELHHFVERLREEVDAGPGEGRPRPAAPGATAADAAAADEAVPIEELLYRGDRALQRALELRGQMEAALAGEDGRRLLDELFELIRLARS